jgi:hypothetical protein
MPLHPEAVSEFRFTTAAATKSSPALAIMRSRRVRNCGVSRRAGETPEVRPWRSPDSRSSNLATYLQAVAATTRRAHRALPAYGRAVRSDLTPTPNKEPTTCSNQSWMRA